MDLKLELLADSLADILSQHFTMCKLDSRKLIDTKATKILSEIKDVICDNSLDDFYAIDKIVDILSNTELKLADAMIFK